MSQHALLAAVSFPDCPSGGCDRTFFITEILFVV